MKIILIISVTANLWLIVIAISDAFKKYMAKKETEAENSRCCGRCDGINDICVADMVCELHNEEGCEICYGKR